MSKPSEERYEYLGYGFLVAFWLLVLLGMLWRGNRADQRALHPLRPHPTAFHGVRKI